jgi:hypothetical protein
LPAFWSAFFRIDFIEFISSAFRCLCAHKSHPSNTTNEMQKKKNISKGLQLRGGVQLPPPLEGVLHADGGFLLVALPCLEHEDGVVLEDGRCNVLPPRGLRRDVPRVKSRTLSFYGDK